MIKSYRGEWARLILEGRKAPKGLPHAIAKVARRKLVQLADAAELRDLLSPPGNRLEALNTISPASTRYASTTNGGSCSDGRKDGPEEVEICDYH